MNIDNKFLVLSDNEVEEVNGGLGPIAIGAIILFGGSALVNAFNGYQEESWKNRKK